MKRLGQALLDRRGLQPEAIATTCDGCGRATDASVFGAQAGKFIHVRWKQGTGKPIAMCTLCYEERRTKQLDHAQRLSMSDAYEWRKFMEDWRRRSPCEEDGEELRQGFLARVSGDRQMYDELSRDFIRQWQTKVAGRGSRRSSKGDAGF